MHKIILFDWGGVLLNADSASRSYKDAWNHILTELKIKNIFNDQWQGQRSCSYILAILYAIMESCKTRKK